MSMKIAAAAYPLEFLDRWNAYVGKLRLWVRTAAEKEAELLVFPEYAAMELASLAGEEAAADLGRSIDAVSERLAEVDGLHASLAREFGVHICAASAPLRREDGSVVNRARLFGPDGTHGHQDKLIMTRFERDEFGISPGDGLRVFDTALGRIGILVCYDAEFPLIARALVEAGAEILLVPASTETERGYWRVRIGAQAGPSRTSASPCTRRRSVPPNGARRSTPTSAPRRCSARPTRASPRTACSRSASSTSPAGPMPT
jgi:predicted amidohydrolase